LARWVLGYAGHGTTSVGGQTQLKPLTAKTCIAVGETGEVRADVRGSSRCLRALRRKLRNESVQPVRVAFAAQQVNRSRSTVFVSERAQRRDQNV